jgi:hypothetical protein
MRILLSVLFLGITFLGSQSADAHKLNEVGFSRAKFQKSVIDGVKNVTAELDKKFPPAYFPETQKVSVKILSHLISSDLYKNHNNGAPRITVRVVNNKGVNAMAAGDGRVYVFAGIMDVLKSDDELAAVLAHELAHVTRAHQERIVDFLAQRGVNLGQQGGSNPMGGGTDFFAMIKAMIEMPKFKREMEKEADEYGLEMLVAAGYPAEGMSRAFMNLLAYTEILKAEKEAAAKKAQASGKQPQKQGGIFGGGQMGDMLKRMFEQHPPLGERIGGVYKESKSHNYSLKPSLLSAASKEYIAGQTEVRQQYGAREEVIKPNPFPRGKTPFDP